MDNKNFKITDITIQRQLIAIDAITDIIKGKFPNTKGLRDLGGDANLRDFSNKIDFLIDSSIWPYIEAGNKVRSLVDIRDLDIFKKQEIAQNSTFFKHVNEKIINRGLPDKDVISEFYGNYASFAYKTITTFQKLGRERNCGRPYIIHPVRVSVNAKELGFNDYYVTLSLLHDTDEEFTFALKDKDGKIIYGLERLDALMKYYIPKEMHSDELMLTNKSALIMDHLASKKYSLETKKDIISSLSSLLKDDDYKFTHPDVQIMIDVLKVSHIKSGKNIRPGSDLVKEDALWEFYNRIYLNDLAEEAYASNNFNTYELKGLDLFDNCGTIEADKFKSKSRVILKSAFWVDKANGIILRAKEENRQYPLAFEQRVGEIMNFANYSAQEMLITYFAKIVSKSSHFDTGLHLIKMLRPVLYKKENIVYPD